MNETGGEGRASLRPVSPKDPPTAAARLSHLRVALREILAATSRGEATSLLLRHARAATQAKRAILVHAVGDGFVLHEADRGPRLALETDADLPAAALATLAADAPPFSVSPDHVSVRVHDAVLHLEHAAAADAAAEQDHVRSLAEVCAHVLRKEQENDFLRLYARIFEESHDAIAIIDADGRYVQQNPSHEKLTGYSNHELHRLTPAVHLGEDVFAYVAKALSERGHYRGEHESRGRDGQVRVIDLTAFLVPGDGGAPRYAVGIKRDVTPRKRQEEQSAERARRLRALYELSEATARAHDAEALLSVALNVLGDALDIREAAVVLSQPDASVTVRAARRIGPDVVDALEAGFPALANATATSLTVEPVHYDLPEIAERAGSLARVLEASGLRALTVIPLVNDETRLGALVIASANHPPIPSEDERLAANVARSVAFGLSRHAAAAALARSEERYRALVRNMPGAVFRTLADDEWTALVLSDGIETIAGYPASDFTEGRRTLGNLVHADDVDHVKAVLRTAVEERNAYSVEYRMLGHEGRERCVLERGRVSTDELGRDVIDGVLFDVTESKLAADARERNRLLLEALVETAPNLVVLTDASGRILIFNRACERLTGYTREEVAGRSLFDVLVPETWKPIVAERFSDLTDPALGDPHVNPWRLKEGGERLIEWRCTSVQVPGHDDTLVLGVGVDVTKRRQSEAELEAARRKLAASETFAAIGSLVSGVAHEIRTPLTYMANSVHLTRRRLEKATWKREISGPLAEELTQDLAAVLDGLTRVRRIVDELRRYAKMRDARERVGFDELVAQAIPIHETATRGRVALDVALQSSGVIEADPYQVQQVVLNLLANAAEAMPRGGTIRLATRTVDRHVELVVEDEGSGIPDSVREAMFEPFFTTKSEGTGLGLSIVQRIVDAHRGTIRFDTGAEGTKFIVRLPLIE